ncbi:DEAD/DEAH box RNA helicase [Achlya hypogyna]|uniref:DEAD/DEAH box RNA helicase n=1 Tax=Achlya hypogyna TaxID=1202772 RepID=A0A1V9ZTP8_ACHHY|nr:DEAD/DEAH box RNA helicase [Achlya hypogyna]
MSVLFGAKRKRKVVDPAPAVAVAAEAPAASAKVAPSILTTFADLGLDPWLVAKCSLLGLHKPTPVQVNCIPEILAGRDVLGCAQTGSGKTAAFALPILHNLAKEMFGPFALVLTPTRELAFQIGEQFQALGSGISLRTCVVVGGVDMMTQALALQERPHVIIATPGRLRDHMLRANPPNLKLVQYVVLDEADRLLSAAFSKDLAFLLDAMGTSTRQTLLFSATMTADLKDLEAVALTNPYRFDATPSATTVAQLKQSYLFVPAQIKTTYLMYLMSKLVDDTPTEDKPVKAKKSKKAPPAVVPTSAEKTESMVVFVATCKMCQLVAEIALELELPCVVLHSMMGQARRLAALGKFKSGLARVLICTDVASRGLDIPEVTHVLNFDLPRDADDYIHRVGRTARAGRRGTSISIVTQHDIELLQNIEAAIGKPLDNYEAEAPEAEVLKMLNDVTTATRVAKMKMTEHGFDDKLKQRQLQRQKARQ